jgi:uncharacterized protein with FMN-binding domain
MCVGEQIVVKQPTDPDTTVEPNIVGAHAAVEPYKVVPDTVPPTKAEAQDVVKHPTGEQATVEAYNVVPDTVVPLNVPPVYEGEQTAPKQPTVPQVVPAQIVGAQTAVEP